MENARFEVNGKISVAAHIELIKSTPLGERRPLDDRRRLKNMLKNTNRIVTVRHRQRLIGMARTITDFFWGAYISDLAADPNFQKIGFGKKRISQLRNDLSDECKLLLLAGPFPVDYYPHVAFVKQDRDGFCRPDRIFPNRRRRLSSKRPIHDHGATDVAQTCPFMKTNI